MDVPFCKEITFIFSVPEEDKAALKRLVGKLDLLEINPTVRAKIDITESEGKHDRKTCFGQTIR